MSETANPTEIQANAELETSNNASNAADSGAVAEPATATATEDVTPAEKPAEDEPESEPAQKETKRTPAKRTPSKRLSFVERAQKESEELVKNLGGSLELEGGRRTRSSTRGTSKSPVAVTPPPAKRARASPATPKTVKTPKTPKTPTGSRGRGGRGRKIESAEKDIPPNEDEDQPEKPEDEQMTDETEKETIDDTDSKEVAKETEKADEVTETPVEKAEEASATPEVEKAVEAVEESATKSEDPVTPSEEVSKTQVAPSDEVVESLPKDDETDSQLKTIPEVSENSESQSQQADATAAEPAINDVEAITSETKDVTESLPEKHEEKPEESSLPSSKSEASVVELSKDEFHATASDSTSTSTEAVATETTSEKPLESTPEPMEVDSSSKSDDIEMISLGEIDNGINDTDIINKMDIAVQNNDDNAVSDAPLVSATPALSEISSVLSAEQSDSSVELINNVNEVSPAHEHENSNSNQNNGASAALQTVVLSDDTDTDSNTNQNSAFVKNHEVHNISAAAADVSALENSNNLNAEINKNDADSCDPKVASLGLSPDGVNPVPASNLCN